MSRDYWTRVMLPGQPAEYEQRTYYGATIPEQPEPAECATELGADDNAPVDHDLRRAVWLAYAVVLVAVIGAIFWPY